MRKLISFKISSGKIPAFSFEWQKTVEGLPEVYRLKSVESPDPALMEAAHAVAVLSSKMVSLNLTDSDADSGAMFHGISFEYQKELEGYFAKIKADMYLPWNGYNFAYSTPKWRVYYSNSQGDLNNNIRNTIHTLLEECWKYIDGNRAQVKLLEESAAAES